MRTSIETSRLALRPFLSSDVETAFTWFGDPAVMQFTVTGPDKSIEDTKRRFAYFDELFGVGFVPGTMRTLWVIPHVGARMAELMEAPIMLVVTTGARGVRCVDSRQRARTVASGFFRRHWHRVGCQDFSPKSGTQRDCKNAPSSEFSDI